MAGESRVLLAAAALLAALVAGQQSEENDEVLEDEGDSAPFMLEVRHVEGRVCAAALVSLRTALSSAACARPSSALGDVWAVAASAAGGTPQSTRVLRLAYAEGGDLDKGAATDPWAGVAADVALLELAEALPGARPILMATAAGECEAPASCQLVRRVGRARLRVVDAGLVEDGVCAARGPRWPALRGATLCLAGSRMCQSDWGTGVVCSGKLCGVVSRSALGEGDGGGGGGGERCGDVHAAASVPRWRHFLHCAHTRGSCGRDGDCVNLCKEQWLVEKPAELVGAASMSPDARDGPATPATDRAPPLATTPAGTARPLPLPSDRNDAPEAFSTKSPKDTWATIPTRTTESVSLQRGAEPADYSSTADTSLRPAFEFEPNRVDFKVRSFRSGVKRDVHHGSSRPAVVPRGHRGRGSSSAADVALLDPESSLARDSAR